MARVRLSFAKRQGRMLNAAKSSRGSWTERSGLLVWVKDEAGRIGRGEASPLPGFSPDTVEESVLALQAVDVGGLREHVEPDAVREQLGAIEALIDPALPAACFALQTALLDLWAQRQKQPVWRLLEFAFGRPAAERLPLAAWIQGESEAELCAAAARALERGIRTLKLKLAGPRDLESDLRRFQVLRRFVGDDVALRFDANGAFEQGQALGMLQALAPLRPEFVEEPVAGGGSIKLEHCPVPLALDESLLTHPVSGTDFGAVRVLVLKPTLLGGFSRAAALRERATALGLDCVVSHTLEGPVALCAAAHLALVIGSPGRAQGLDRHPGLSAWKNMELGMVNGAHVVRLDKAGLGLEGCGS
jgi:o-succinylbenzoate synthase